MRHSEQEIERGGEAFKRLADELDPATVLVEVIAGPREIDAAADAARLREAVHLARAHGRSWNQIAVALGVSCADTAGHARSAADGDGSQGRSS